MTQGGAKSLYLLAFDHRGSFERDHSGLSIAMGNASHEVQRAAHRVTTTIEDNACANAVERFILP